MKIIITERQYKTILREMEGDDRIEMKFYMFDWDDNLRYMPTQVYAKTKKGGEIGMGTEPFAHHREKMANKIEFEFGGETIKGLGDDPFKDFRSGYDKFKEDLKSSKNAPSWNKLVQAINGGYPLAIITARGHKPDVLKSALNDLINSNEGGIDKTSLFKSIVERKELLNQEILSEQEEVDDYLDNYCFYYTVGYYYPSGGSSKPEVIKSKAMREFQQAGNQMVNEMNRILEKLGSNKRFFATFGFSDDDLKNVKFAAKSTEGIDIIYTGKGEEKKIKSAETGKINPEFDDEEIKVTDDEEELKIESTIKKYLSRLI